MSDEKKAASGPENRPLWAPWRVDFIRGEKPEQCFLCGLQTPAPDRYEEQLVLRRYENCFVILNRYPYNSGHLLVAPYRHTGDIAELSPAELHEIIDVCVLAKKALSNLMNPAGFNIGFNLGAPAGAGLAGHLHMHVVPRWNGDNNFMPIIANTRVVPESLAATAELLRKVFS